MTTQEMVFTNIVKSALRELSDSEYQSRVWLRGDDSEVSSMGEVTAALFNDSGLGQALEKGAVTFTLKMDADLRELRIMLKSSLAAQSIRGTEIVIASQDWGNVRRSAHRILNAINEASATTVPSSLSVP